MMNVQLNSITTKHTSREEKNTKRKHPDRRKSWRDRENRKGTERREQQLADLTRGYEQSKADYDSLLKKKNESELATNLEKQQQGEHFRVMDPPSLPVKPYSPNRLKLFAIGLGVGLTLGFGLSFAFEMADDR